MIVVDDELRPTNYEIVAANLLDGAKRKVADRIPVYALFVDPPLGRAG